MSKKYKSCKACEQVVVHNGMYKWVIFLILAIGYAIVYFHRVAPAVVAPELMLSFDVKGVYLGVLASAYFYPYAVMQLPSGLLSDSFGPRKTVTLFSLIAGVGALVFGMSPNFSTAVLGRVMVGLGVSMLFVPTLKILTNWFTREEFPILTGILMAIGGVGWLLAAAPLALLVVWVGWRFTFLIIGLVSIALALLTYLVVRDNPLQRKSLKNSEEKSIKLTGLEKETISLFQGIKIIVSEQKFWPLAIWFFFTGGILFGFGGLWAGPYLTHVYNLSKAEVGAILMMIAAGMIVGSPVLSYVSEKVFQARKPVLLISSSVLVCVWILLVLWVDGLNISLLYAVFFLLGVFASGIVVIGFTAAKELFPAQIVGTSTGMVNLFPFAGGALFQPLAGFILDHMAKGSSVYTAAVYRISFLSFLLAAVISLVSIVFMHETYV